MAKNLTHAAVVRYRPARRRRELPDGGAAGLHLVVQPSGRKSWHMRFRRPSGRPAKLHLGPCDLSGGEMEGEPVVGMPLTLAGARQLAAMVNRDRAMGIDVIAAYAARRQRRRAEIDESAGSTYAALARRFVDEHARPKTRRWRETARLLGWTYPRDGGEPMPARDGLAMRWRDRAVRDVDGGDVYAAVDEACRLGIPGIPARTEGRSEARGRAQFSALSSMFGWLVRHRLAGRNPCAGGWRPNAPRSRDRVLATAEICWFWHACDGVDQPPGACAPRPFAAMLRLLLLTGQRLNEVAGMRRDELSDDGATWTIPGDRTKNRRTHVVPLPPLARELIAGVESRSDALVFSTTGRTPISGFSKAKARLSAAMLALADGATIRPWRLHDLRRTCATQMAELGIEPHIVEAVLNHVSGHRGGVAGVYNRARYDEAKRAALARLAAHVSGLVSGKPANVAQLRRPAVKIAQEG